MSRSILELKELCAELYAGGEIVDGVFFQTESTSDISRGQPLQNKGRQDAKSGGR